jgi:hypothetical protein
MGSVVKFLGDSDDDEDDGGGDDDDGQTFALIEAGLAAQAAFSLPIA